MIRLALHIKPYRDSHNLYQSVPPYLSSTLPTHDTNRDTDHLIFPFQSRYLRTLCFWRLQPTPQCTRETWLFFSVEYRATLKLTSR